MKKPSRFQIFGERNSGTNYISKLLSTNFHDFHETGAFGWKHGRPGTRKIDGCTRPTLLKGRNPSTVFVVVVRDPIDWLHSFYATLHHTKHLKSKSFSSFVRSPLLSYVKKNHPFLEDLSLETKGPYANVIAMRNEKYRIWLDVERVVSFFILVNYDHVVDNREAFLSCFAAKFGLARAEKSVTEVNTVKGSAHGCKYVRTPYPSISLRDFRFVSTRIDTDQEMKMGIFAFG
jgi:hypothetical protein